MKIKLTESTLNKIVSEAVRKVLCEANDYDPHREWMEIIKSKKKELEELALYLKRNGIESVRMGSHPSGYPRLEINTDEYLTKDASSLGEKFAKARGKRLRDDMYPALTFFGLENY